MKTLVKVTLVTLLCLSLIGCQATLAKLGVTDEPRVETAPLEVADEPGVETIPPGVPKEIEEEPQIVLPREEEGEHRILYESPEPKPEPIPLFTTAELDLSSSTPEEIIVRILYFDKDSEHLHWETDCSKPIQEMSGGKVWVEIWKGTPTEEERRESRQRDEAWYEEFVVLGRIGQDGFYVRSSKDVIVIPTSTLNPYDGEVVTLRVYIMPVEWGVDFNGQNPNLPGALNYLEALLVKNW